MKSEAEAAAECPKSTGVMRSVHARTRPARERAGYQDEGHLRGLIQPAQAGFVITAEGFSPADGGPPRTSQIEPAGDPYS
jgi:hypothetical protein